MRGTGIGAHKIWSAYHHHQNISIIYQPPTIQRIATTTNRALGFPNENYDDNSNYLTPARAKVRGAVELCNWIRVDCFNYGVKVQRKKSELSLRGFML